MSDPHIEGIDSTAQPQRPGFRSELESQLLDEWRGVSTLSPATTALDRRGSLRWAVLTAAAGIAVAVAVIAVVTTRPSRSIITTTPSVPATAPPTVSPTVPTTDGTITPASSIEPAPSTTEAALDPCARAIAPPSLVDGSPPGEPSIVDGNDGAPSIATWGAGQFAAVHQPIGAVADPAVFESSFGLLSAGGVDAAVVPPAQGEVAPIEIHLRGDATGCERTYSIDPGYQYTDAVTMAQRWLDFLVDATPVPGGRHDDFAAPIDYFGLRSYTAINRFSPIGVDLGALDDTEVATLLDGIALADGRRIHIEPNEGQGRCVNRAVTLVDGTGRGALHPDLAEASSIVATPEGVVVATRDVCADGQRWGDPGTSWQLVRLDLRRPENGVTVLAERHPDLDQDVVLFDDGTVTYAFGDRYAAAISVDGRYLGLREPYNSEQSRWEVRDLDSPETALELPSSCATAADIVAAPSFLADGTMVVARFCPAGTYTGDAVIDQIGITDLRVMWSATVAAPMLPSYGNSVELSVVIDDGPWVIVSGSPNVEQPPTSVLLHGDRQLDISHLGFWSLAFSPDELIS